jgi:hypothetical protein
VARIEWTYTIETSRLLRALALVGMGAIGSLFVLAAVGAALVVGTSLLDGNFAILGLVLAFTLLFGRRLAGQAALFNTDVPNITDVLPARELAAASVGWVVVAACLVALDVGSRVVYAVVVVVVTLSLSLSALLHSEGHVDTDEGVVDANRGEASLAAVATVSRYDLGKAVLLRVHYHDGAGASAPRLLTVPRERADAVQRALVSSDAEPPESDRNPVVAKTLYAFAVGCLALAAGAGYLAVTAGGDAAVIGWYGAVFAVVLAGLFGWLGSVEG